ncbi:MAG: T9SS type A sorting domain-containing protein, partial [Bacteroidales bacterium]|nr:T9SS type A sorting domain-containing protein [Bacteroidales bacterium]
GEEVSFKIYDHVAKVEYDCTTNFTIHTGEEHMEIFFDEDPLYISFETATTGFTKHIQAYTSDDDGYYLISSPVGGVDPTAVTNLVDGDFDLYKFDQSGDSEGKEWFNYETSTFTLMEGQGYLYANAADVDLVFNGTGEEYTGTGMFGLVYYEGKNLAGYNIMGNPYPGPATVDRPFYTLNNLTNEYIENVAGARVEAMTGIVVIAEGASETVQFTPATGEKSANAALNITRNGKLLDRAIMTFEGRNLPKAQFNANHTKVYMPVNGKDYAVAAVESFGEMPLNFKAQYNGNYTLNFTSEMVNFNYLHLIDNMTGAEVDLLANPTYNFDANTNDYESRFKLVFATSNASNSDFAYVSNDNVIVNGEGMLKVIDMTGRVIATEQINGVSSIKLNAAAGVYVLQLNDKTQKIVVR